MTMLERNGILAGGTWVLDHTKIIDSFPAQDALANVIAETLSSQLTRVEFPGTGVHPFALAYRHFNRSLGSPK